MNEHAHVSARAHRHDLCFNLMCRTTVLKTSDCFKMMAGSRALQISPLFTKLKQGSNYFYVHNITSSRTRSFLLQNKK